MRLFVVTGTAIASVLLVLLSNAVAASAPPANDVAFVIPAGSEAAVERGQPVFQFPKQIDLQSGKSVVITNHDYAMHYFFDVPVAPGETIRKSFPRPGTFVYQGGLSCSLNASNTIRVQVQ